MPESVSGVDAILDGLRERATRPDDRSITRFDPFVSLADAEAAVSAALARQRDEIVAALRENGGRAHNCLCFRCRVGFQARKVEPFASGPIVSEVLAAAADEVTRRFPNGGTHDDAE